jgi:hypothetical protein
MARHIERAGVPLQHGYQDSLLAERLNLGKRMEPPVSAVRIVAGTHGS